MKFKIFAIYAMLFAVCVALASCDDDSRTGVQGYSDCIICQGKGYCEKSEMFGLKTSYWIVSFVNLSRFSICKVAMVHHFVEV